MYFTIIRFQNYLNIIYKRADGNNMQLNGAEFKVVLYQPTNKLNEPRRKISSAHYSNGNTMQVGFLDP